MLWDNLIGRVFFTVDRVGITKLYYFYSKDQIILSSHIKNISHFTQQNKINPQGLEYYLSLRLIPAPTTILNNVYKVRPGFINFADKDNQGEREYWPLIEHVSKKSEQPFEIAKNSLDELISESLESCTGDMEDPVGIFLSSGVDSALLAAMLKRMSIPVVAYTAGYDQKYYTDESRIATTIARSLGVNHIIDRPSVEQLFSLLKQVISSTPEPLADASFLSQLALTKLAMDSHPVFIDGSGADNLFGGMSKTKAESMLHYYNLVPPSVRSLISRVVPRLPSTRRWVITDNFRKMQKFIKGADLQDEERQLYWVRFIQDEWLKKILLPEWFQDTDLTSQLLHNTYDQVGASDRNLLAPGYFGLKNIMPWMAVFKLSCIELATGSSIRNPFLSKAVIEFALRLPDEYKQKNNTNKLILRQLAKHYMAPRFADRSKQNFSPPIGRWMKTEFRSYILDTIYLHEFFNRKTIETMLSDQFNNQRDWQLELWTIFVFQKWWEGLSI